MTLTLTACLGGGGGSSADKELTKTPYELLQGGTSRLDTLAGKPVVVNFFAKWCAPCVAEMQDFEQVHQEYGDRVTFIGFSTQESVADAQELVTKTGVTYQIARDPDGQLALAYQAIGMPLTVLLRPDGSIAARHTGALTAGALRDMLEKAFF
jgi:thiol-disulfide isomerase/thioredoxin